MPKETTTKSKLAMAREGKTGTISIDGPIGWEYFGVTYRGFKQQLADLGDVNTIEVSIKSPGGVITDGVAMANLLAEHQATIHTYNAGEAASMGSVILLAGDKVFIPDNAMTFIHKPLTITIGNANEMRKTAEELDKFEAALLNTYRKNFKGDDAGISALMESETWYTANEMADKFNNVVVVVSGEEKAAATSEPLEIFGKTDIEDAETEESKSLLTRAILAIGKLGGTNHKEVDMTPEEVLVIAKAAASEAVKAYSEAHPVATPPAPPASPEAVDVAFVGDMEKASDVEAHLKKVQMAQLKAAADLTSVDGVMAYQAALKELAGTVDEAGMVPSNSSGEQQVLGTSEQVHSVEKINASIERMTNQ